MASQLAKLRSLAASALCKNMHLTAICLSEQVLLSPLAVDSDVIFCAKCYYGNGEPRRCLSLLERKGLLANQRIVQLSLLLKPKSYDAASSAVSADQCAVLDALLLAAQCLFLLGQYDDCVSFLLDVTFLDESTVVMEGFTKALRSILAGASELSSVSALYCIVGKSLDLLDNREKGLRALVCAIELDPCCTEAGEYLVQSGMLSDQDRHALLAKVRSIVTDEDSWLVTLYQSLLKVAPAVESSEVDKFYTQSAEYFYQEGLVEEAYRFSRYAFTLDPFNCDTIVTYIATMVELRQSSELFYLSHELVKTHPKFAVAWYVVGCYYWTQNKFIAAAKYFQKTVKVDKRFVPGWVMLGHSLSAQDENEHAIAAYRTAVRLAPGNHRPAVFMAKELIRSNYASLALQVLLGCVEQQPMDPLLLNETGAAFLKQFQPLKAVDFFEKAIFVSRPNEGKSSNSTFETSVICNYATALRKSRKYEDALFWYNKGLSVSPLDAATHLGLGYTHHLMRNFKAAILCYHKALSIQANSKLSAQLLHQALEDCRLFEEL